MGKSFVLRNEHGDPVGYLAQGMHAICCRIRATETDEVIVFLQDGSHRSRRVEHAGEEMEWREENCAVIGAVALENGRVSAATGENVRRKWAEIECRKKTQKVKAEKKQAKTEITKPVNDGQEEQTLRNENAEEKAGTGTQKAYVWPQRRWPPPPCWKTAVYCHGAWDEEKG